MRTHRSCAAIPPPGSHTGLDLTLELALLGSFTFVLRDGSRLALDDGAASAVSQLHAVEPIVVL